MRYSFRLPAGLAVFCFLSATEAHTWLENLRLIGSNGTYVGEVGYSRAYVPRTESPGPDIQMVYKLPPPTAGNKFSPTDLMCSKAQQIGAQTQGFPALQASPGDNVALRYLENGHVTKLEPGRPARGGMVFVYGTKNPKNDDTYLGIHRVWNAAGTGGDKRGKLLATRPYDDGQCWQYRPGAEPSLDRQKAFPNPQVPPGESSPDLLCQTDIQLPQDAGTDGQYTVYWVWEWPLNNGQVTVLESYTACADIKMTSQGVKQAGALVDKQPWNGGGIAEQLKNHFMLDPSATPATTTAPAYSMPSSDAPPASQSPPSESEAPEKPKPTKPAPSSVQPIGFITVTVTASQKEAQKTVTEYITVTPAAPEKSQAPPDSVIVSTATVLPLPGSSKAPESSVPYETYPGASTPAATPTQQSSSVPPSSQPTGAPSAPPAVKPFLPAPAPGNSYQTTEPADQATATGTASSTISTPTETPATRTPGGVFHQPSKGNCTTPVGTRVRHRRRRLYT